jgi:hypothetical protein
MSAFEVLAGKLGHAVSDAKAQGGVTTEVEVRSIEELRVLLGPLDGEERRRRHGFLHPPKDFRARVEAFLLGDGEVSEQDGKTLAGRFPIKVQATSLVDKTLPANYVWDLGTSAMPVVVNLDTLTMEPGSRIEIRNTVLRFSCNRLVRNSAPPAARGAAAAATYDFGIFGANTDEVSLLSLDKATYKDGLNGGTVAAALIAAFRQGGLNLAPNAKVTVLDPNVEWRIADFELTSTFSLVVEPETPTTISVFQLAMEGSMGSTGGPGTAGAAGDCVWGEGWCEEEAQPGNPGGPASDGGPGGPARNGLPGLRADISVGTLVGALTIQTRGGNGAMGGKGGTGGSGGRGGDGGRGEGCGDNPCNGGAGHDGQPGGNGGPGGKGGNGGPMADIFVTVGTGVENVTPVAQPSAPGLPGPGGDPGAGGGAGTGGAAGGGKAQKGPDGQAGRAGSPGALGTGGDTGGLAGRIIINGKG